MGRPSMSIANHWQGKIKHQASNKVQIRTVKASNSMIMSTEETDNSKYHSYRGLDLNESKKEDNTSIAIYCYYSCSNCKQHICLSSDKTDKRLIFSLYNSYTNLIFHEDGGHFVVVPDDFLSFLCL